MMRIAVIESDLPESRMMELLEAVMLERGMGGFKNNERNLFQASVKELLDGREPDLFLPVDLDGRLWLLVVVDGALHLHHVEDDVAETLFFGKLEGQYTERTRVVDRQRLETAFQFTDERLPGKKLDLVVPEPRPAGPGKWVVEHQIEAMRKLRAKLREWASPN